MGVTKAQQKANTKYVKNNYDTIITRVTKGKKDVIKAFAEQNGDSIGVYFRSFFAVNISAIIQIIMRYVK